MREQLVRQLLGEVEAAWNAHDDWVDEAGSVGTVVDDYSGLLHAVMAIRNGAVFVFPRSMYTGYRKKVPRVEYAEQKTFPKLDLPYRECLFVEFEDDADSEAYGFPTALVVAYYDDHPEGLTYTKSANVMFAKQVLYNAQSGEYYETEDVKQMARIQFWRDPCFYSTVAPTLVVAWLNSAHSEKVEHTVPTKVVKKRERTGKLRGAYAGKFTELREKNPTYSLSVDRVTGQVTAHLVRGHFKRRKSGTFWWKPHVAGSGELKKRAAYVVHD